MVTLTPDKLAKTSNLVETWAKKMATTLHNHCILLGKLLYVAQVYSQAHLFLNRMLDTMRQCTGKAPFTLSPEFKKDLAGFQQDLPVTDWICFIHEDDRSSVHFYVEACESGCGAITSGLAYHITFPYTVHTASSLYVI